VSEQVNRARASGKASLSDILDSVRFNADRMTARSPADKSCPLEAVDRRLADVHNLWHQAEGTYFDPDAFRLAVQNGIQTLRSVTFLLQNYKKAIPNWDQWYGDYVDEKHGKRGKWQERLHADPLMRWVVEARNKIEKRSDLEIHSFIRAEVLASYLDDGPHIELPADLFQSVGDLLRSIPTDLVGEHIRRHGVLRVQRRWVENSLPAYELLDAIAIAYGKIAELIHDAHRQVGHDPPDTIHDDDGGSYNLAAMGWRLPCMIGHEHAQVRAVSFSLAGGEQLEFKTEQVDIKAAQEAAVDCYGTELFKRFKTREYNTLEDLAIGYFELARAMFLRDGYHGVFLFLVRYLDPVKMFQLKVETKQERYLLNRHLSAEITKSGADAAFVISEFWTAAAASLKPYESPADSTSRKEGLSLTLVRQTGEPFSLSAMILRDVTGVSLGKTEIDDQVVPFQFASFYRAWGRPIPGSWLARSTAAFADMLRARSKQRAAPLPHSTIC
jgi:hypothetical protein